MYLVYNTETGKAVSIGSVLPNEIPAHLTVYTLTNAEALGLRNGSKRWEPTSQTTVDVPPDRREANKNLLSSFDILNLKLDDLKTFLTDVDIQVVLDQPNNTALTTNQLNRALKSMIRQDRKEANAIIRLFRYTFGDIHPELLDDVSDVEALQVQGFMSNAFARVTTKEPTPVAPVTERLYYYTKPPKFIISAAVGLSAFVSTIVSVIL